MREREKRGDAYREWRHLRSTFQKELHEVPNHYPTTSHCYVHAKNTIIYTSTRTQCARKTTTSQWPMLISTHPGFLSLAFTHSLSLKYTNNNTLHTHKPIFHPKLHGGKSLSSSTNHSFSSTLAGTVPSSVPALLLKSPRFSGKHWPIHCHSTLLLPGLVTVQRLFLLK